MIYLLLFAMFGAMMWWMNRSARNAQEKQRLEREKSIVLGANVVTTSGFLGRIVDIDGDAITLESPAGDETVWLKSSIASQMDLPLAEDGSDFAPVEEGSLQRDEGAFGESNTDGEFGPFHDGAK